MPNNKVRDREARRRKAVRQGVLGQPVLVLNSGYMPINVTKAVNAVQLIKAKKAFVVLEGDKGIATVGEVMNVPSVIRLTKFVNVPDPRAVWSPKAVFERDGYVCQYCGKQLDPKAPRNSDLMPTIDHIMPRHLFTDKSRASTWSNTCCACTKCNRRKGGLHPKSMKEAGMKFFNPDFEPKRPRGNFLKRIVEAHPEWSEWIPMR